MFHGGEEYEFVFTVSPKYKKIIIKNAKLLKQHLEEEKLKHQSNSNNF